MAAGVARSLDDDGRVSEVSFEGQGCAISTAATSLLTDELTGMTREELLRLPKETVLELLGIEISATRVRKVIRHFEREKERTRAWRRILEQTTGALLRQSEDG